MNNVSEKMSEEVVVDHLSYFTWIYPVGLRKNMENTKQNSPLTEI